MQLKTRWEQGSNLLMHRYHVASYGEDLFFMCRFDRNCRGEICHRRRENFFDSLEAWCNRVFFFFGLEVNELRLKENGDMIICPMWRSHIWCGSRLTGLIRWADFHAEVWCHVLYLMCLIGIVGGAGHQFDVVLRTWSSRATLYTVACFKRMGTEYLKGGLYANSLSWVYLSEP